MRVSAEVALSDATDHGRLIGNAVTWALGEPPRVGISGPGPHDVAVHEGDGELAVCLVDLPNPMAMRGPVRELIPVGPLTVSVAMPPGCTGATARLLGAGRNRRRRSRTGASRSSSTRWSCSRCCTGSGTRCADALCPHRDADAVASALRTAGATSPKRARGPDSVETIAQMAQPVSDADTTGNGSSGSARRAHQGLRWLCPGFVRARVQLDPPELNHLTAPANPPWRGPSHAWL
jgi:hypothetical protein